MAQEVWKWRQINHLPISYALMKGKQKTLKSFKYGQPENRCLFKGLKSTSALPDGSCGENNPSSHVLAAAGLRAPATPLPALLSKSAELLHSARCQHIPHTLHPRARKVRAGDLQVCVQNTRYLCLSSLSNGTLPHEVKLGAYWRFSCARCGAVPGQLAGAEPLAGARRCGGACPTVLRDQAVTDCNSVTVFKSR